MEEYISKTEIHKLLDKIAETTQAGANNLAIAALNNSIDIYIPAANVQPVKYSKWIPLNDGTFDAYCENCGVERGSKAWNTDDFHYCFNCGAKMYGGDENG